MRLLKCHSSHPSELSFASQRVAVTQELPRHCQARPSLFCGRLPVRDLIQSYWLTEALDCLVFLSSSLCCLPPPEKQCEIILYPWRARIFLFYALSLTFSSSFSSSSSLNLSLLLSCQNLSFYLLIFIYQSIGLSIYLFSYLSIYVFSFYLLTCMSFILSFPLCIYRCNQPTAFFPFFFFFFFWGGFFFFLFFLLLSLLNFFPRHHFVWFFFSQSLTIISLTLSLSLSVCLSACLSVCLSAYLSLSLFLFLSLSLSLSLSFSFSHSIIQNFCSADPSLFGLPFIPLQNLLVIFFFQVKISFLTKRWNLTWQIIDRGHVIILSTSRLAFYQTRCVATLYLYRNSCRYSFFLRLSLNET